MSDNARPQGGTAAYDQMIKRALTPQDEWPVKVPLEAFDVINKCLLMPRGCEDIDWIRKHFGDPVEITQSFIRHAYLLYRGIGVCSLLDRHVPAHLRDEHAAFVKEAKAKYREGIRQADSDLVRTGDVAAYDQAVAIAFLRHRGERFGALEGAFTPRFDPYY